jgi:hypothetical protein
MTGKRIVGYIYWLLPAYLLFQTVYQVQVLRGLEMTYEGGISYVADVVDFRLKNMQAQSNGVIELKFDIDGGETVQKRMTLPVQLAAQTRQYGKIPVRYLAASPQPIVMIPTYNFHHNMVRINVAILVSSFLGTLIMGFFVLRWARKIGTEAELKIEWVDR